MNCRHCRSKLDQLFLDLGTAPPSNAYLAPSDLNRAELYYPLRLFVCTTCWLVQTEDYAAAGELFNDEYAYFSSTSASWLEHAKLYSAMVVDRFALNGDSMVVEIASNDGYLLKNFVAAEIPCLGIEPTHGTAEAARMLGIPVIEEFFGEELGARLNADGQAADLIAGNNVYAHVPDINDFTRGLRELLKPQGVVTLEFPHVMRLVEFCQFDTVYHEHFSYLSLLAATSIFEAAGLRIFDLEELPTHGGSLRVYGCRSEADHLEQPAVAMMSDEETRRGMNSASFYSAFQIRAEAAKNGLLAFLLEQKRLGKRIAGYGAAAKGNTLLNYAGIRSDLLPFVCDAAPSKQGKFLPGSRIPILPPDVLNGRELDYLIILPWNIAAEVMHQNAALVLHGARFVTAIPEIKVQIG